MINLDGMPLFTNCSFSNNQATRGGAVASRGYASIVMENCLFSGNSATEGGAVYIQNTGSMDLSNCTFANNSATVGAHLSALPVTEEPYGIDRCIFAFGSPGEGIFWSGQGNLTLTCVDVFGNAGGDWTGAISDQAQTGGNLSSDPLFCGDSNPAAPFSLSAESLCAPDNNAECGLIGALPVGCSGFSGTNDLPIASGLQLRPCFPNPFNPSTTLSFELSEDVKIDLEIFDASGGMVCSLVSGNFSKGLHQIIWQGRDDFGQTVGSGVYFARLRSQEQSSVQKMVLLK